MARAFSCRDSRLTPFFISNSRRLLRCRLLFSVWLLIDRLAEVVELVAGRPVRVSDDEMVSTRRWMYMMSADAAFILRHLESSALSPMDRPGI